MLEQRGLVLGPWTAEPRQRPVRDADTGEALGFVRCRPTHGWLQWLLNAQTLQVFETEDASLLLTLHRPSGWVRAWQLDDADGRAVATVSGVTLRDANGFCLAVAERRDEGGLRYVNGRGVEVGACAAAAGGVCLTFSPEATNPFLRMALLAATLILA
jgi:hypothetical protein